MLRRKDDMKDWQKETLQEEKVTEKVIESVEPVEEKPKRRGGRPKKVETVEGPVAEEKIEE